MGIGAGLYMCDVVVKKFTFAISSPDEFLLLLRYVQLLDLFLLVNISDDSYANFAVNHVFHDPKTMFIGLNSTIAEGGPTATNLRSLDV